MLYTRDPIRIWSTVLYTCIYIIYIFYTYIFFLRLIRYTLRYLISFIIILAFKSVVAWVERGRLGMGREEGETRNGKGSANDKWKTEQMRFWRLAKKKKKKLSYPSRTNYEIMLNTVSTWVRIIYSYIQYIHSDMMCYILYYYARGKIQSRFRIDKINNSTFVSYCAAKRGILLMV